MRHRRRSGTINNYPFRPPFRLKRNFAVTEAKKESLPDLPAPAWWHRWYFPAFRLSAQRRAAHAMLRGSVASALLCAALQSLPLGLTITFLQLINDTRTWRVETVADPDAPNGWGLRSVIEHRTLGEVMAAWREESFLRSFPARCLGSMLQFHLGLLLVALMQLPFCYRSDGVLAVFSAWLKVGGRWLIHWMLPILLLFLAFARPVKGWLGENLSLFDEILISWGLPLAAIFSILALLYEAWGISRLVYEYYPTPILPPICEICGYDLTHWPEGGRCSECGWELPTGAPAQADAEGFSPDGEMQAQSRPSGALSAAIVDYCHQCMAPAAYYREMPLDAPEGRLARAATLHLVLIALLAPIFFFVGFALRGEIRLHHLDADDVAACFAIGISSASAGWVTHRAVMLLTFTWWIWQKSFPDFDRARRLYLLEFSYLWLFCAYSGLIFATFFLFGFNWMSDSLGQKLLRLAPGHVIEPWVLLGGNGVLILVWLFRLSRAAGVLRFRNADPLSPPESAALRQADLPVE